MSYNPNFASVSSVPASSNVTVREQNNTGTTLLKLTPVYINASGDVGTIDVSIEARVLAIAGILGNDVVNGGSAEIVNSGRIENVIIAFNFGDPVFVSKTGGITNIKPSIGVAGFLEGDFSIRLGVVGKNKDNALNKDLLVNISIEGQL